MKKKYTIDSSVFEEKNLSIEEFISLISLQDDNIKYEISDKCKSILQEKGYIKIILEENKQIVIIREKGKLLIKELEAPDNSSTHLKEKSPIMTRLKEVSDFDLFITEYRNIWKGTKPGAMGSQKACKEKMIRWKIENPGYSNQDIIKAAKAYVHSVNDLRYLQQADYVIFKKDPMGESSRLSAFIDEADAPENEWSSKLS